MNIKRNPLKILTTLIAALIAALFGFGSSKALAKTKVFPVPTIEERLTNIREVLKNEEKREILNQSDGVSPVQQRQEVKEEKISQSWNNWPNYWGNGWRNWANWYNG